MYKGDRLSAVAVCNHKQHSGKFLWMFVEMYGMKTVRILLVVVQTVVVT